MEKWWIGLGCFYFALAYWAWRIKSDRWLFITIGIALICLFQAKYRFL